MDVDSILKETGGFGRFQKCMVLVLLFLAMSLGSFTYWSQILILLIPDHHCQLPLDLALSNISRTGQCQISADSPDFVKSNQHQSYAIQEPWVPYNGWSEYFSNPARNGSNSVGCQFGWEYDFEVFYPTVSSDNNWVCDQNWKVFFCHTIYWIGSTLGYFFCGFFLDRFGRWKVVTALLAAQTLSSVATVFVSSSFPLFCALRLLAGLSAMPMQSSCYTLAVEMIESKKRKLVSVSTAIYWLLAAAVLPWIALSFRDWKWVVLVGGLPGPILLVIMKFVPESPSWLLSQGETEEAFKVFAYISRVNGVANDSILLKMKEYLTYANPQKVTENILKTTASLLRTPNIRKKTLLLYFAWFSVCLSYHGNNLSQSTAGDSNVFLLYSLGSAFEIPFLFVHLVTVDRIGRKLPILLSLMAVSILAPAAHFVNADSKWVHFGVSICIRGLFSLAYNVLFQLGCELFPTTLRGRGVFFMRTLGDIGTSVAPFILTMGSVWPFLSSAVFSGLSLMCAMLILGLPETKGEPLPQTVQEAEQFGKDQGLLPMNLPCSCCTRFNPSETRSWKNVELHVNRPTGVSISKDESSAFDDQNISVHI